MYKKTGFGEAALFGAALIWGTGFVAQSLGSDTLSPFTYNGVRNVIGSLTLLIFLRLFRYVIGKMGACETVWAYTKVSVLICADGGGVGFVILLVV